jgi:hypothetical protein
VGGWHIGIPFQKAETNGGKYPKQRDVDSTDDRQQSGTVVNLFVKFTGTGQSGKEICNGDAARYLFSNGNGFKAGPFKIYHEYFICVKTTTHTDEKFFR